MLLEKGKVNVSLDGQFGSTGKGLYNGWLAGQQHVDIAMSNAAPNAGHTLWRGFHKNLCYHLPMSGVVCDDATIVLTAGSVIDPELLKREMEENGVSWHRLRIHPRAAVLDKTDQEVEKAVFSSTTNIASTQKGVGAALARKIKRSGVVAQDHPILSKYVQPIDIRRELERKPIALMEVPQGYDLSINSGLSYPYCTSREVTVAQALSDAGVHPSDLGKVHMTLRTFPIRVGNIVDESGHILGWSGPFYGDQKETSWEELGIEPEYTTVTGRVRRVATFSAWQYERALRQNLPDHVFLNFVNYCTENDIKEIIFNMRTAEYMAGKVPELRFGLGKEIDSVVDIRGLDQFYGYRIYQDAG
jgi:adenylosuccinate synthase